MESFIDALPERISYNINSRGCRMISCCKYVEYPDMLVFATLNAAFSDVEEDFAHNDNIINNNNRALY